AVEVCRQLLEEHNFAVDAPNGDGDTPLLLAAARGHVEVVEYLVELHDASPAARDAAGATALHKACAGGHREVAEVLCRRYGADASVRRADGATALHLAAAAGDPDLVAFLVEECRADVEAADADGNRPLHAAAAAGRGPAVRRLVEGLGANRDARNRLGQLPFEAALAAGHVEVSDCLLALGSDGDKERHGGGFRRAGRWLGQGLRSGHLPDLSLEHVSLLPVGSLLEFGRFPTYYDCSRKKALVRAASVPPGARVLALSHPWESPGNPDPSGHQFEALRRFLLGSKAVGGTRPRFDYVWLLFSCASQNRIKPDFKLHLRNVVTAYCRADRVLVVPKLEVRPKDGTYFSDLTEYSTRGWCAAEFLCALRLSVPLTLSLRHGAAGSGGGNGGDVDDGNDLPVF
ncbi:unnamed protein product, partial [Phaeothamnion confervicola]